MAGYVSSLCSVSRPQVERSDFTCPLRSVYQVLLFRVMCGVHEIAMTTRLVACFPGIEQFSPPNITTPCLAPRSAHSTPIAGLRKYIEVLPKVRGFVPFVVPADRSRKINKANLPMISIRLGA